ncbi:hypothetical protein WJX75_006788 [Coccomyxa subellipsoidea]|uniref:Uncharacterized protein n=1 Tax=Coccomyxa subellipsoidea TaxID=248742 RepID=A0ABR2Z473_9CHLO
MAYNDVCIFSQREYLNSDKGVDLWLEVETAAKSGRSTSQRTFLKPRLACAPERSQLGRVPLTIRQQAAQEPSMRCLWRPYWWRAHIL